VSDPLPDPLEFFNVTKSTVLDVVKGRFFHATGLNRSSIKYLECKINEDVDDGDIILVRGIGDGFQVIQSPVTHIKQLRGRNRLRLQFSSTGSLLAKKDAEGTLLTGDLDTALATTLAIQTGNHAMNLVIISASGGSIDLYPCRGYVSDALEDLIKMANNIWVEGHEAGSPTLYAVAPGAMPGGLSVFNCTVGDVNGKVISIEVIPDSIVNVVKIEGEREDYGYNDEWDPAGGGPWTSHVLTAIPTSSVSVWYNDNVNDPSKANVLQGGPEQDSSADYYVDPDQKTIHFTGHTVVGSDRRYYFDYTGRYPVVAISRNDSSVGKYWESSRKVINAVVKTEADLQLIADKYRDLMSVSEHRVIVGSIYRQEYIPNTAVQVRERVAGLDRRLIIQEVTVDYPTHACTIVFGEYRPSLAEYIALMKDELRRIDQGPNNEGDILHTQAEHYRIRVQVRFTGIVSTSLNGSDWTEHWRTTNPVEEIVVV